MEKIRQLNNLCGIDVGCTNIKMAAVVNESLHVWKIPSGDHFSHDSLVKEISDFYRSFHHDFSGLGIAFSGCTADGYAVSHTSLPCLERLSADDFSHLNKNVRLINDSNATALAGSLEFPDAKVLVGVTNGSGIGCGIVINGQLFTGGNGFAGEIYGNPVLDFAPNPTKVGRLCSGSKILKLFNDASVERSHEEIIESSAQYMGATLVSLIHTFNPDVLYFAGGGFSFDGYLELTKDFVGKYAYSHFLDNLSMTTSSFKDYSGCIGAMKFLRP